MSDNNELVQEVLRQLQESRTADMSCILCDELADMRGLFVAGPEMSQRLGSPEGIVVVYPICSTCQKDPLSETKSEEAMVRYLAFERN